MKELFGLYCMQKQNEQNCFWSMLCRENLQGIKAEEWLQACGISEIPGMGTRRFLICHRHFNPDQIGEVYLKKNAVPQRYLDTPPPNKNDNDREPSSFEPQNSFINEINIKNEFPVAKQYSNNRYRKSGRRCIIRSCRATYRSNPKLRFFSFPDPKSDRFKKWVSICKLTPSDLQLKNILICEKHFWKAELCGKRYTAEAEPKFFLSAPRYKIIGPSDPNYKVNEKQELNEKHIKLEPLVGKEKSTLNKCIIKSCGTTSNNYVDMIMFPKEAVNLFDVWSDIFKLDPNEIFNIDINAIKENDTLYICKRHSLFHNEYNGDISPVNFFRDIKSEYDEINFNVEDDIYNSLEDNMERSLEFPEIDGSENVKKIYENEMIKLKKEAEKEKIKHLCIISNLKEEIFKLKDELSKFQ
ncbi:uncharacterized protein LOC129608233 isoform X4 [Condylostylus longicornis]|uniref:uncharacterized protein LOC129608233 isoform X4 n=1 Tax=Condylostylus longicornis TaxID=2530218 RepID=UPI00244E2947|nr:uncharacterized protein LOC129608233 isoform X4 [Condylostylus longicornis]